MRGNLRLLNLAATQHRSFWHCVLRSALYACIAVIILSSYSSVAVGQPDNAPADDAPANKTDQRPPSERKLGVVDELRVAKLQLEKDAAVKRRDYKVAINAARKIADLRRDRQGADHWETFDAELMVKHLEWQSMATADQLATLDKARELNATLFQQYEQGQYPAALESARKNVELLTGLLPPDHILIAIGLNDLAFLSDQQARYDDAKSHYKRALEMYERLLPAHHPAIAQAQNNLGSFYHSQNDNREAEPLLKLALESFQRVLPAGHPQIGNSLNNLASLYLDEARYLDAESFYKQALAIREQSLADGHPLIAESYNNLAALRHEQGRYAEAEPLYMRALQILEKGNPPDYPKIALILNNIATFYESQDREAEAETLYKRALEIRERPGLSQHPETAGCLINLAALYRDQSRCAEAELLYTRAIGMYEQLLPADHPDIARALDGLALLYDAQGRYAEAEPLLRRALEIAQNGYSAGNPNIARYLNNLAGFYERTNRYAEAELLFKRAGAIFEQSLPPGHLLIAANLENLAGVYEEQGRYEESESLYKRTREMREVALPANHFEIARSLNNLAKLYDRLDRNPEAEQLYHRVLEILEQKFPTGHPARATSLNNLALLYYKQQRFKEAEPLLRQAGDMLSMSAVHLSDQGLIRSESLDPYLSIFRSHLLVLLRLDQVTDAWTAWESTLARGFLDEYAARQSQNLDAEQLARLRKLAGQLRGIEKELVQVNQLQMPAEVLTRQTQALQQAYLQAAEEMSAYRRDLARQGLFARQSPATFEQVQSVLMPDQALVGWLREGAEQLAIVVRAEGAPTFVRLEDADPPSVNAVLNPARVAATLQRNPPPADIAELQALIASIRVHYWDPVVRFLNATDELPAVRQIIVLGHDDLLGVPIELLAKDDLVISYCPSATLYLRLSSDGHHGNETGAGGLLAIGDPSYQKPPGDARLTARPRDGVLVKMLAADANVANHSLQSGDVIIAVGKEAVHSSSDLRGALASVARDKGTLRIWRGNLNDEQGIEFEVAIGERALGLKVSDLSAAHAFSQRELASSAYDSPGTEWRPLPGTRVEVDSIAQLFQQSSSNADVYLGWQAATETLTELQQSGKLSNYKYLHLAAHGTADSGGARLILSLRDGIGELRADDVLMNWDLNAEQVVLSSCQSARGKRVGGEGFMGFAQALLVAGARSVVLSLWEVDDQATTLLMQRYYQNLLGQRSELIAPMHKAEALREAKLWLRSLSPQEAMAQLGVAELGHKAGPEERPFDHPSYWSAFILIGDPQ